jgi:hypothetical protein
MNENEIKQDKRYIHEHPAIRKVENIQGYTCTTVPSGA